MTQPSVLFPRPTALLALAMFFMTPVLKAQLDVDTLDVPTATVSAVQAGDQDPFAVTNLEVEDIQKQDAAQDVPFLLRLTPSAVVSSDAGHGIGYTSLRIRGVDQSRINVTINGVPLNDAESQGVFWVDLPDLGSSMTGLQIQRGVGTSTNGPAAFGATVSVNTLGTLAKPGIRAVLGGGSFGTQRRTLAWNTGMLQDGWSFEGRASRIESDGWVDRATSDLSSLYGRVAKRWETGRLSFTTTLGHERTYQAWYGVPQIVANPESTDEDILNWVQGSGEYDYGADTVRVADLLDRRAQHNYYHYENEVDDYRQDHYQIHLDQTLGDWNFGGVFYATLGAGFYEQFRQDDDLSDYGLAPLVMGTDTTFATDLVRRRWLDNTLLGTSWTVSRSTEAFSQVYGVSRSFYSGDHFGELIWMDFGAGAEPGDEYYRSLGEKTDLSAFGKWSGQVSDLRWHGEIQARQVLYQTSGRDNDYSEIDIQDELTFFNPKAGLTWTPSETLQGFVSAAVAHREPARSDYLDSPQDTPLRPERLLDVEAGAKKRGERWAVGATLYNMQYTDQLVATGQLNDVGNVVRVNAADSYRRGVELEAGAQLTSTLRLDANATLAQNKIAQFEETVYDYDGNFDYENIVVHENTDIALSPNAVAMGMLTYEAPKDGALAGLSVSLIGKHVGQQFLDNTSNEGRALAAYTTLDAVVRAERILSTGQALTLSVFGNNLLDAMYSATGWTYSYRFGGPESTVTENYVYPQAGRHGFVTLAVEF
ncbi:MAG: TonB-dependent receptor [Flavobacteriales bacterium]